MRQILIQFAKFALAAGLVTWFIRSGRIDLDSIRLVAQSTWVVLALFGIQFLNIFVNNLRWQLLLYGQGIKRTFAGTMPLTFIGLFFNLAIPGAVGGDLIKAYYIAQEHSSSRAKAAMSVAMDRVVGLFSFVCLALMSGLVNFDRMMAIPQLKALFLFVIFLFIAFITFFGLSFSKTVREHHYMDKFLKKVPAGSAVEKIYDAVHAYRHSKGMFLVGILLSVFAQSLSIMIIALVARQIGQPQSWSALFFVVPLGFIVTALPISPAGIGVGQVAFHQLFAWYLGQESTVGATLITVIQAISVCVGLLGAVFYFTRRTPEGVVKGEVSA